jgi:long-subunit fatty acid transport protein
MGMGGAFLARADDATAASWNPAGLSYLRRPEVTVVGGWNTFDEKVGSDEDTAFTRFRGFSPNFAAATFPFAFGRVSGSGQVSYQRAVPFDGHRRVDQADGYTKIDADGGFDAISVATGWSVSRKVRLGVSVNRWLHGYDQNRFLFREPRSREILAEWGLKGWNVNVGAIFSPTETLNLAVVGNTAYTADVPLAKSRTDFRTDDNGSLVPISQGSFESDDVTIDFPGAFGLGLSWRPRSQLTLSADYNRTLWSHAYIYNYFVIKVGDETPGPSTGNAVGTTVPPPDDRVFPKLHYPGVVEPVQVDSEQIRLGAEYVFFLGQWKVPARAGFFNDRQILLDAYGDAPRYNGVTVGTGVGAGPLLFDIAYLYEWGSYVRNADEQPVRHRMQRFLMSLIYRFGGHP